MRLSLSHSLSTSICVGVDALCVDA
jgi:hypothetical protein